MRLSEIIEKLAKDEKEPWKVVEEKHDYNDGTTHFNHVRYTTRDDSGEELNVEIASYLTPETAYLLVEMHNNLPRIVEALQLLEKTEDEDMRHLL